MAHQKRPWEREPDNHPEAHTVSHETFERLVAEHKNLIRSYHQQIAYYVVSLGYEPTCLAETLEIASDLIAGARNREMEKHNANVEKVTHQDR